MNRFAPFLSLAILASASLAHAEGEGDKADKAEAPAASVEKVPVVHYPPPLVRAKLIAAGVVLTGIAWGASFAVSTAYPESYPVGADPTTTSLGPPGFAQLKIPVVGPWMAVGKTMSTPANGSTAGCAADDPMCGGAKIGIRTALYVIDGIAQAAGLGLIIEAIVMKTESPAAGGKDVKKSSALGLRVGSVEIMPAPMVTPTMRGVGFIGTF